MAKRGITFGSKQWDKLMENSAKAVEETGDVFLKEAWRSALKIVDDLEAGYNGYFEYAQHYTELGDTQIAIFNGRKTKDLSHDMMKVNYDPKLKMMVSDFNTLRGTNTSVKGYASYSKTTNLITVGITGPDILYMEYGTGDIGDAEESENPDVVPAREAAVAAGIPLKPYNSGPTIREGEDGVNYWRYHGSVHFGMPGAAVAYTTFKDHKKKLVDASRITLTTYLKSAYSGKDTK